LGTLLPYNFNAILNCAKRIWQNMTTDALYVKSLSSPGVSNTRPAGPMWTARAFCVARHAFWEFSHDWQLRYLQGDTKKRSSPNL